VALVIPRKSTVISWVRQNYGDEKLEKNVNKNEKEISKKSWKIENENDKEAWARISQVWMLNFVLFF
jgi:hypothetical protein